MKLLTTIAAVLISISAFSQEYITRGQDTIAYTSPQGEIYNISIYNDLTAEELHYITSEYRNNNFTFRDNEDLRLTMSRYMEDGSVTANWELTQNEQRLLNKYNVLAKQSNKSSSPTSKNNVTVREYLKVEYNEGTFSENGEEISMEEIEGLTKRFRVAKRNLKTAKKNISYAENNNNNNAGLVVTAGVLCIIGGIYQVSLDEYYVLSQGYEETTDYPGIVLMALGAGVIKYGLKMYSSPEDNYFYNSYKSKADVEFKKVAKKLNKAIVRAGPTAQPSNQ